MKFICEHCHTKYTIADERVRGKNLKIRCKKCSQIVTVSGVSVLAEPSLSLQDETDDRTQSPSVLLTANAADSEKGHSEETDEKTPLEGSREDDKIEGEEDADGNEAPLGEETVHNDEAPESYGPSDSIGENFAEDRDHSSSTGDSLLEERFKRPFRTDAPNTPKPIPGLLNALKRSAASMEMSESDDHAPAQWFVGLNDRPIGPVTAHVLAVLLADSSGNKEETLVWKEGMDEWVPFLQCTELQEMFIPCGEDLKITGNGELDSEAPSRLFGGEGELKEGENSPLKGSGVGNLAEQLDVPDGPLPSTIPPLECASVEQSFMAKEEPSHEAHYSDEGRLSALTSIIPPIPSGRERTLLLISIGFFLAGVVAFVLALFIGTGEPKTIIKEKIVEKTKIVYRDRPLSAGEQLLTEESGKESEDESQAGRKGKQHRTKAKQGDVPAKGETSEDRKKRLLAELAVGGSSGTSSSRASEPQGSSLSQKQMSGVVSKNKSQLQSCYEQSLKKGEAPEHMDLKVKFKVSIGGSGMVKNLSVTGNGARYPNLKNCLSRSVKKWVFPAAGAQSKLEFPILFTPSR